MASTPEWSDQQVEVAISILLRVGVTLAAAIVIVGGSIYLIHNGHALPDNHVFHGEPTDLRQVPGVLNDVLALRGRGIIQLRFQCLRFGNSTIDFISLSR